MAREVMIPVQEEEAGKKKGTLAFLKELPVLIALALAIALLIKAVLVQAFFIPSSSMEPTLQIGDRVLVNKLTYRFREPARGDVIVFKNPYGDPCSPEDGGPVPQECHRTIPQKARDWFGELFGLGTPFEQDYIKRIVALPGETIEMREGVAYVCSEPDCVPLDPDGSVRDGEVVDFPSTEERGPQKDNHTMPAYRLGDDEYYVLGDFRANSSDSRVFRGIGRDTVVGKAFVVVWPPNRFAGL